MSAEAAHALPVVDLAPFMRGDAAGRHDVAAALAAACTDTGCFYLVGHGIADARLAAVLDATRSLFALPDAAKDAIAREGGPGARGYARMPGGVGDAAKEEYYLGRERADGEANRWPAALPDFTARMLGHVDALHHVAARLMAAMAVSLELPEDRFAAFCTDPIAALRLVRYPPGNDAAAHTDFGSLTLLLQDEVGGLQVRARDGAWIDVAPVAGTLVVNVGDLFERWTNGRYRSTPHRVAATPTARISAPFFLTGAADHEIACLPSCLAPGETARHAPTTVAEHLRARFATQGY